MKQKIAATLSALAFCLSFSARGAEHAQAHGHDAPQKLQLDDGKKWATDAALRQAMGTIKQAMNTALPQIHRNNFSAADYRTLAATVSQEVNSAIAQCKLEPKADAMLHLVIADLLAGAEAMKGESATSRRDGVAKVRDALQSYGRYFAHPGWQGSGG